MRINTRSRVFVALLAGVLPLAAIMPYAFFVSGFKVLFWVVANFYLPFWVLLASSVVFAGICSFLLYRVNIIGVYLFQASSCVIVINGAVLAMSERRHGLLVLLFLLSCLLLYVSEHMRSTILLPYFHSRRKWWESYPKRLPQLDAVISSSEDFTDALDVRLSNLGPEGCFVFRLDGALDVTPRFIRINGAGFSLSCPVEITIRTVDDLGCGLRFAGSPQEGDWQKELRDHLVILRRSGYVS